MKFRVGFEVGTGEPVDADLHHLFISGVTQHSGKTTSLEAFVERVGFKTLVFRCGRGEIGFESGTRITPFFRERTDWRFVEGLLSAHLKEKVKFYRGEIIKACRGASTLRMVHGNVKSALAKTRKDSFVEKIYVELDQYLSEALPQLDAVKLDDELRLNDGVNVIDLEGIPTATQQLVIGACGDRIMEKYRGTILVIPEAWEMIPGERGSPVKLAAEALIRKGAKVGNYLWLDSQQLTGLEMDILRNVDIWMFGRQTLDLEKERVAKMIPGRKVKPDDVHGLTVGQFFVVQYGEVIKKVYVQPAWLPEDVAKDISRFKAKLQTAERFKPKARQETAVMDMDEEERKKYEYKIDLLEHQLREKANIIESLKRDLEAVKAADSRPAPAGGERHAHAGEATRTSQADAAVAVDLQSLAKDVAAILSREPYKLDVSSAVSEMTLHERVHRLTASDEEPTGRMALLIADGFFDERRNVNEMQKEFQSRGWLRPGKLSGADWNNTQRLGLKFAEMGFLRYFDKGFVVVLEAKRRITRRREE